MKIRVSVMGASMAALAVAVGAPMSAQAAPVVTNGSFEDVQIGPPFVSDNPADIPGWTHSGDIGDGLLWGIGYSDGGGSIQATGDGNQFVTLGGGFDTFGSGSWSTTITGLTPGQSYNLDFKIAYEGGDTFGAQQLMTVGFSSGASGGEVFVATPNAVNYWSVWQPETVSFKATSSSAVVVFSVTDQINDIGLDAVSVNAAVPEPATWAMLLIGFGGLGAAIRSRRRALLAA
jgi:hypothetical protein